MVEVPTLAKIPAIAAFNTQPSKETARILSKQVLDKVRPLDGLAPPLLLETICKLDRNQYHVERFELIKTYYEHTHSEFGRRRALVLMLENAERSRLEGSTSHMAMAYETSIKWALKAGNIEVAFAAGDSMAAHIGRGLSGGVQGTYRALSQAAEKIGDMKKAGKYRNWAQEAEQQFKFIGFDRE